MAESEAQAAWRSLHPASVAVNLLPTVWRAVRATWVLLLALVVGSGDAVLSPFELGILLLVFGPPVWNTVLHWLTVRYRVAEGRLEIRSGLLHRKARVIPPERIQNVELVRNLFHRATGLVELRVETASGSDVEGMLSALSEAEATRLMRALDEARRRARPAPADALAERELVRNGVGDLLRYGLSTARLSLVAVALGVLYEASITSDPELAASTAATLGINGTLVGLVALVTGAWLVGAGTALVRHWGFRLALAGDRLVAEQGLFTRRRVELAQDKVQLITVVEPLARRWLGFGSLHIETAAAGEKGGTQTAEAMAPVVETGQIVALVREALPDAPDLRALPYRPPHPLALRRALVAAGLRAVFTTLPVGYLAATLWGWVAPAPPASGAGALVWTAAPWAFALVGLLVASLFGAWLDHRMQGWWVGPHHVVGRTGWWVRTTHVIAREKVQALELVQGLMAQRLGLGRLVLRVAGSQVALPVLGFDDALELELELSESVAKGRPAPPPRVEHDGEVGAEQQPGDGLGHDAHQGQGHEQDPVAAPPSQPVGGPAEGGQDPEAHHQQGGQAQGAGERADPPIEPELPRDPDPDLDQDQGAVQHQQDADHAVQGGDQGPEDGQAGQR